MAAQQHKMFDDGSGETRQVVLPWKQTINMCISNVKHRMGRSILTFICIAVVVAFFMSSLTYQSAVANWSARTDIHTVAVLEKAGIVTHDEAQIKKQRDESIWLMTLSGILCLIGITNTILMSVTERFREIGTLKCLGALDNFIIRLFMIESALIGVLASIVGCAIGFILAYIRLGAVFEFKLLSIGTCASALWASLPTSFGLGTILTILASIYPTYVASRMKPVDAMRVEV
jgi:putative ABC transport system permease protein